MIKHDAMVAFFVPKINELAGKMLGFNYSPEAPEEISLITNYSDAVRKQYIIGAEKEYGFTILIVKPYSTETLEALNLEAMNYAQAFMDWLDEQNRRRNYPVFPDGCQIKKMENMQNMPNLAGVNAEEGLARYMIQCKLIYFEKGALR